LDFPIRPLFPNQQALSTMTERNLPIWTVPVRIEDVPEEGAHFELSPDDKTRADIATLAGLRTLSRLVASFDVTRSGSGLRVVGEIAATAGQTCVVSLEPVENEIRERIDLVFAPAMSALQSEAEPEGMDPDAKEPPEALVDGTVDLGAIAIEFLILGIDPYPRKPGVVFEGASVGEASSHPFAGLAKLKEKRDPGDS
jgi:uncharacterized metal-binding protein YceD (DUF177 family)